MAAGISLCFMETSVAQAPTPSAGKKILFLAGPRDHGFPGRHEYERDLRTLATSLEQSGNVKGIATQLIVGALPRDLDAVRGASAIVIDSSSDRADNETHPLFPPNPSTNGRGYDPETTAYLKSLDELIRQNQIGVVEVFRQSQIRQSATFNFTPYLVTALIFIVVTIPLARLTDWLNERSRRRRLAAGIAP